MRLPAPFIKLPLRFDTARLRAEVGQFSEGEWRAHPQGFAGNSALILVSHEGGENDDTSGRMLPAPRLDRCPYLRQVMASFQTVIGRSRLMRLDPGSEVTPHSDIDYYWRDRVRIHVPIITDSTVRFNCDGVEINMAEGEAWIFDNWRPHHVINGSGIKRIHLVIDTVGTAPFWHLASRGLGRDAGSAEPALVEFDGTADHRFAVEARDPDAIAHPAAVKSMAYELVGDLRSRPGGAEQAALEAALLDLANDWQALWTLYGDDPAGYGHYALRIQEFLKPLNQSSGVRLPSNGIDAVLVLQRYLMGLFGARERWLQALSPPRFDRPVIIVAAPRSGSTLLFETLSRHPAFWTLGDEAHGEIENVAGLSPRDRGFDSNALGADAAGTETRTQLLKNFTIQLRDHDAHAWIVGDPQPPAIRFLEKTPKNALRIPFLNAAFPDALFLFLYRDSAENLGSMLDAWGSGRFVTYPDLPGWNGPPWSLLLTPGWRKLTGQPLARVVANQWQTANQAILDELSRLPRERWKALDYATLVRQPGDVFERACRFLDLPAVPEIVHDLASQGLALSRYTLSAPGKDKWRRHEAELQPVLAECTALMQRLVSLDNRL